MIAQPSTHTWDLSDLYQAPHDPQLTADLQEAARLADELAILKGQIARLDSPALARLLTTYETVQTLLAQPSLYSRLAYATNTQDDTLKTLMDQVQQAATRVRNQLVFIELELKGLPQETFDRLVEAPALSDLRHWLSQLRAEAPHALSSAEEQLANLKNLTASAAWKQLYTETASRMTFAVEGQTLNDPQTRSLLRSPQARSREAAHQALYGGYQAQAPLLASIFNAVYQDRLTDLQTRNYPHPLAEAALDDQITPAEIEALLESTQRHYPLIQRFYRLKARHLGYDQLPAAHRLAPWGPSPEVSYTQASAYTLEALNSFSPQLGQAAQQFFDRAWIDVWPRPGKRGGAFCSGGLPQLHPYILLNHTDTLDGAHTLAHEMGHGVHFYLARQQRYLNFGATTPLAETASVFAEILLDELLSTRLQSPEERLLLLAGQLEDAANTAFRQVMYVQWELRAMSERGNGALSAGRFDQLWEEENQRLYGESVAFGPIDRVGWSSIPHLVQYRYYCYSYAYGFLLVLALYNRYRQERAAFVPKFLEILAAGQSQSPAQILAGAGLDPSQPSFWDGSFAVIANWLDQLEAGLA